MRAGEQEYFEIDSNMNQIKSTGSKAQNFEEIRRPLITKGGGLQAKENGNVPKMTNPLRSPLIRRLASAKAAHVSSSNPELHRLENDVQKGSGRRHGSRHESIKSIAETRDSTKAEDSQSFFSFKDIQRPRFSTPSLKRAFNKRNSDTNMRMSFAKHPSSTRDTKEKIVRSPDAQSPDTTSEEYCTYPNSPNSVLSTTKQNDNTTSEEYTSCNAESRSGSLVNSLYSLPNKLPKELPLRQESQDSSERDHVLANNRKGVQRTRSFRFPSFRRKKHSTDSAQTSVRLCVPADHNNEEDTSLYGTPKDELSPDQEQIRHESVIKNAKEQLTSFFQPADNKLAMKLFGNEQAIRRERLRQQASAKWIIHPCSRFRFYWDFVMLCLLLANLIVLPIAIAFFLNEFSPKWVAFNVICDIFFVLDLIINFRTGIIQKNSADEVILEPRQIACHYLKTWFFVDLVSSVPVDYIVRLTDPNSGAVQAGRAFRILRFAKLLSLLRFLRLSRLFRYVQQFEQFLGVAGKFMRIFHLIFLMLLLGHWSGCLQFLVPMLQEFPADSWVAKNNLQTADWTVQYTWAFFKALSHMLCIGYGQIPPSNTTDAWLTIISMITGATCYALLVAHATTLIQSFDTAKRLYNEKFKQVEEYMAYRKLPKDLRTRITDYYENRFQGRIFDEDTILAELSDCLRKDVINYNCRDLVSNVPFFNLSDTSFVDDVVSKLRSEVFQPRDKIIEEGEVGHKMYFIHQGQVEIVGSDGNVVTTLSDGSYFGEICLLTKERRVATVRAVGYCFVFSLHKDHFEKVLDNYPLMRRTMESIAAKRVTKLGKDASIVSTRKDLENDLQTMEEIIKQNTPLVSEDEGSEPETESILKSTTAKRKFSLTVPIVDFPFRRTSSPKRTVSPFTFGRKDEKDRGKERKTERTRKTSSVLKALITEPESDILSQHRPFEPRLSTNSYRKSSIQNSISDGCLSRSSRLLGTSKNSSNEANCDDNPDAKFNPCTKSDGVSGISTLSDDVNKNVDTSHTPLVSSEYWELTNTRDRESPV